MSHLYGTFAVNGVPATNAMTSHTRTTDVDIHVTFTMPTPLEHDFCFAVYFTPAIEIRTRSRILGLGSATSSSGVALGGSTLDANQIPRGSMVSSVVGTGKASDAPADPRLSHAPFYAVYHFAAHQQRGSFSLRVPDWICSSGNEQCLDGRGIWLFTRRSSHRVASGASPDLWEREAHGWAPSLFRLANTKACSTTVKISTSSADTHERMRWLERTPKFSLDAESRAIHVYNKQVHEFWQDAGNWPNFDHLDGLGRWYDSSRSYPLIGLKERLPMFAQLVPITFDVPVHPVETARLFNHLATIGTARLGYTQSDFVAATSSWQSDGAQAALLMELVSEVCTMPLHAMHYTIDNQHGMPADEWEFLNNALDPLEARFDCEDGAEFIIRMVRTVHALSGLRSASDQTSAAPSTAFSHLMTHLAHFLSVYEPCMLLCTLRLQGQGAGGRDAYTYHACVWMADRDFLEMHAHSILDTSIYGASVAPSRTTSRTTPAHTATHATPAHTSLHTTSQGATQGAVVRTMGFSASVDGGGGGFAHSSASDTAPLPPLALGPAYADPAVYDTDANGIVHVGESQAGASIRRAELGAAAHHAIATSFRTSFILESTTYVASARLPTGSDQGETADLVYTTHNDTDGMPAILKPGDGSMKLSNAHMYGTADAHNFYGRGLFFVSPYLIERGITDMVLYDERTPTIMSIPVTSLLDYDVNLKLRQPSDGSEDLSIFVGSVHKAMRQLPAFQPLCAPSSAATTGVEVVDTKVLAHWWPFYLRVAEVDAFLMMVNLNRGDQDKVHIHEFDVFRGTRMAQVLVHKSVGAKFVSPLKRRYTFD